VRSGLIRHAIVLSTSPGTIESSSVEMECDGYVIDELIPAPF